MIQKARRTLRGSISEFTEAFRSFTHNARTYLFAAVLQSVGGSMIGTVLSLYIKSSGMRESVVGNVEGAFGIGMAFIALVRMLSIFAGGLLGGFLPGMIGGAERLGYQWTIAVGAVVMAAGLVPLWFVREKIHGVKGFHRVYAETVRGFSAWRHLGRLVAPQAFLAAAGGLTAPFIPLYLQHTLGASVQQIGMIQGCGALVVGIAAFSTPLLARKIGVTKSVLILQAAALPFLFAVPWIGTLTFGVLAMFTRSTLMGIGGPLWNECSMTDVCAQDKPLVAGGLFFSLSIAGFLGNVVGGQLMEVSYTAPYIPAALLWAVGAGLTWLLWVRPQRAARAEQVPAAVRVQLRPEAA